MAREYAAEAPAPVREYATEEKKSYESPLGTDSGDFFTEVGKAGKYIGKEALSNLESLNRGAVTGTVAGLPALLGIPGSIEWLGRKGAKALGADVSQETVLPGITDIYTPAAEIARDVGGAIFPERLTTPTEQTKGFTELGEAAGLPVAPGTILKVGSKGYSQISKLVNQAFGGDAKRLADQLKTYASSRSGAEAESAMKLAEQAESRSKIAEKAATKQSRQAEEAFKDLPGTKTEMEAGRFKPVPETADTIGTRIRDYAENIYKTLKDRRSANAEKLKTEAFSEALAKEQAGQRVEGTQSFKNALKTIDDALVNPDTKLTNASVPEIENQLKKIKAALNPREVDPLTGVVTGRPVSFEGLETLRRFLKDRAFGLPAEGFDAISQQQAGKLAKVVEGIMEEFSPKIKTFIEQYAKDSEPLRVFQSKVGKALIDEQLLGKGTNYANVAAESIPKKVFQSREAYQGLIDAFGGNKAFAENQAKRYFAGELEKIAGDSKAIEKFIANNRTMLNLTNSRDIAESYIRQIRSAEKRGEALTGAAKSEADIAKTMSANKDKYNNIRINMDNAATPKDVANVTETLARQLLSDKIISEQQYSRLIEQGNRISKLEKDANEAKRKLYIAAAKIGGTGLTGALVYLGARQIGQ